MQAYIIKTKQAACVQSVMRCLNWHVRSITGVEAIDKTLSSCKQAHTMQTRNLKKTKDSPRSPHRLKQTV